MMLRWWLILPLFLVTVHSTQAQNDACSYMIWNDEFDYEGAPDASKWGYDTGSGGWGNNELQNYTNNRNNSYVKDGLLTIHAKKEDGKWTSARLITKGKGDFLYGRIEVRAKLPTGRGTWPAIWTLPTDWEYGGWPHSGEIDIMEHVGYDANRIYGTVHTGAYNHSLGTQKGGNKYLTTAETDYHVYAVEWEEEEIRFYVDDSNYFTFKNEHKTTEEWPFDKAQHLLLNLAIGGDWGGAQGVDGNLTEAIFEIDYVRVFSNVPTQPEISGASIAAPGQEVTFTTSNNEFFDYSWTLPDDAILVSGEGSSTVVVEWGNSIGTVEVTMMSPCDTLQSEPFLVHVASDEETLIIPNISETDTLLWRVIETDKNTVELVKKDQNIQVSFNIQSPIKNPSLQYDFPNPMNLTAFNRMLLSVKADDPEYLSNMKVELIDQEGNANSANEFLIDDFKNINSTRMYGNTFYTENKFNLSRVKSIRLYFNYTGYGRKGEGSFELLPIQMKNYKTGIPNKSTPKVLVYPNPFTHEITIKNAEAQSIAIYSSTGIKLETINMKSSTQQNVNLSHLPAGAYIIVVKSTNQKSNFHLLKL